MRLIRSITLCFISLLACRNENMDHQGLTVFRYNESSGITSLDPAFAKDQASIWACTQLYNGLLQLDDELHIKPCIAQRWEIKSNGTEYVFHLRNDVYFGENELFKKEQEKPLLSTRLVRADDFVYSFMRLKDPRLASPGSWIFNMVKIDSLNGNPEIQAPDDSTLIIILRRPFPPFLGLLTMPYCSVVPREIIEFYKTDFRNHPCGTGPFCFSAWQEGVRLIFLKKQNYFERDSGHRLPYLDAVEISFNSDKQSAFIEFLKGNLDFISGLDASYKDDLLTRTGTLQARHRDHFKMQSQPYLNTEYLGILMDSTSGLMKGNPLRFKKIRQALSCGFDKNKMMKYLRNNMGTAGIYGFVPPGMPSFDRFQSTGYDYDPQRARRLLQECGFPEGKGLPEITLSTTSSYQDLCEYMKSQWEELGFKIRIELNQAAVHRKLVAEQKLSFFRASWIGDYPDAENYLSLFHSGNFSPSGPNTTHFRDDDFDAWYNQAGLELNDSIRSMYYHRMDQQIMEIAPVIILYYDKVLRLTQNNITGLGSNAMNLLVLKKVRKLERDLR